MPLASSTEGVCPEDNILSLSAISLFLITGAIVLNSSSDKVERELFKSVASASNASSNTLLDPASHWLGVCGRIV